MRKHDNPMNNKKNMTYNKAYMEKVTKSTVYRANERKYRQDVAVEKHLMHDQSMRKKENPL